MHFLAAWGYIIFNWLCRAKIFYDKMDSLFPLQNPFMKGYHRTTNFYLALVAVVIGVQLFLTVVWPRWWFSCSRFQARLPCH